MLAHSASYSDTPIMLETFKYSSLNCCLFCCWLECCKFLKQDVHKWQLAPPSELAKLSLLQVMLSVRIIKWCFTSQQLDKSCVGCILLAFHYIGQGEWECSRLTHNRKYSNTSQQLDSHVVAFSCYIGQGEWECSRLTYNNKYSNYNLTLESNSLHSTFLDYITSCMTGNSLVVQDLVQQAETQSRKSRWVLECTWQHLIYNTLVAVLHM